jgi:hypothetical protein
MSQPNGRNFGEKHTLLNIAAFVICTFFALRKSLHLRKYPVLGENVIKALIS